jgi:hypothetical protein
MINIFNIFRKRRFKYKINHLLSRLPVGLSSGDFAHLLHLDHSITRKVFDRDRALKVLDKKVIPEERLKIYAFMFQVEPHQLNNF